MKGVTGKVIWFIIALVIALVILLIMMMFVLKRGQVIVSGFGTNVLDPLVNYLTGGG